MGDKQQLILIVADTPTEKNVLIQVLSLTDFVQATPETEIYYVDDCRCEASYCQKKEITNLRVLEIREHLT